MSIHCTACLTPLALIHGKNVRTGETYRFTCEANTPICTLRTPESTNLTAYGCTNPMCTNNFWSYTICHACFKWASQPFPDTQALRRGCVHAPFTQTELKRIPANERLPSSSAPMGKKSVGVKEPVLYIRSKELVDVRLQVCCVAPPTTIDPLPTAHKPSMRSFEWDVRPSLSDGHQMRVFGDVDHLLYEPEPTAFAVECFNPQDGVVLPHVSLHDWILATVVELGFEAYMAQRCAKFWTAELDGAPYVYARVVANHALLNTYISTVTVLDDDRRPRSFSFRRIGFVFKKVYSATDYPSLGEQSTQCAQELKAQAHAFVEVESAALAAPAIEVLEWGGMELIEE